jgi:PAS domain S-box-containing protein
MAGEPVALADLRRQAEAALAARPAGKTPTDPAEIERLVHELRCQQIELEMQNEELRRTQVKLEASQAHYFGLYDLAPLGYVTVGETGLILEANLAAARLLGVERASLTERPLTRFILPADQDLYCLYRKQSPQTGLQHSCELRMVKSDHTQFWARLVATVEQNAGDMAVVRVLLTDITECKQAEVARERSHDLLANLVRLVPGVVYEYRLYPDGRSAFPYSSPGMYDIYEVTPEEVRKDATPVFGRLHPDDHDRVAATIQESARTLREFYCEFKVILPSQGLRWRWSQAHPERMDDGGTLWHGIIIDITDRKRAEEAQRAFKQIIEGVIDAIPVRVFWKDRNLTYLGCNAAFARDAGFADPQDVVGKDDFQMGWRDQAELYRADDRQVIASGCPKLLIEESQSTPAGNTITLLTSKLPLRDSKGDISGVLGTYMDVTERKRAEAEREELTAHLRQAQKLESVGRLAGGVAHDFNNLLMGIMNYVELCRDELPPEHPVRGYLDEVDSDARRSADITKQLLAFARKQVVSPKLLDLNDALAGMLKMLRHLMGEDIAVNWAPGTHLWPIKIDPGQLDQVLANLCVNARDAIAGVGKVVIETANVTLDRAYCAEHAAAAPGEYVRLAVSDTGCGMNQDTLGHLFELFFTTKEVGKGTGLGLATLYGIVEQNHGHVEVQSEVGKGTTFSIYLPREASESDLGPEAAIPEELPRGTETILLAEDEKSVRLTSRLFLEALGYTVLAADTPEEAQRLAGVHSGPIHLLITDVIMPGMNGPDLAAFLAGEHPGLKCLFMSGYTADVMMQRGTLDEGRPFLPKPFSRQDLARKVREVLDSDRYLGQLTGGLPQPVGVHTCGLWQP